MPALRAPITALRGAHLLCALISNASAEGKLPQSCLTRGKPNGAATATAGALPGKSRRELFTRVFLESDESFRKAAGVYAGPS